MDLFFISALEDIELDKITLDYIHNTFHVFI